MHIIDFFHRYFQKFVRRFCGVFGCSVSFSSDGEDYALKKIFSGVGEGHFLDIGSNHPVKHSNTFGLYLSGWSGVCIDPIPLYHSKYKWLRNRDIFLNSGVSGNNGSSIMEFFFYGNNPDNSTFDSGRVEFLKKEFGRYPTTVKPVSILPISDIIQIFHARYGALTDIHFLNLDIEGHEALVLDGLFMERVYPWVICVEDLGYTADSVAGSDIHKLMKGEDYVLAVRTYLSSIYIRKDVLPNLPSPFIRELIL